MEKNKLVDIFCKNNKIEKEILKGIKNFGLEEISQIIYRNGIYKTSVNKEICVSNILGNITNQVNSRNVLEEINEIFCEVKQGYKSRCNSMLEYTSENIVENLMDSFFKEPITLSEVKKGKYLIRNNGRHRCSLLRAHYFNDILKCNSEEKVKEINCKYTVPTQVEELDITKTYSNYLIKLEKLNIQLKEELNDEYIRTGKSILIDEDGNKKVYSDDDLVRVVRENLEKIPLNDLENSIPRLYLDDDYFKEYVDKNLKDSILDKNILIWCERNVNKKIKKEKKIEREEKSNV